MNFMGRICRVIKKSKFILVFSVLCIVYVIVINIKKWDVG